MNTDYSPADLFAGTVYRNLHNAADAVETAMFHGAHADGIGFDPCAAVAAIDEALAELATARAMLASEVTA